MPTNYKKIAQENITKYGTDIGRYGPVLLAHLYSDRTHFIYEILQNAEDAGARAKKSVRISFHLFKNRLEVHHNGKLFDEADVRGICGLVEGTKKDDLTQIGKFGIGFKSVYAYTNTPKIYSGDEAFCIENYVQPYAIEKATDISADETLFVFPFDHDEVSPEESFNEISKRLHDIGNKTLLFLNYIEEIAWHIEGQESGNYIRDIKQQANHKKVYVISKVGDQTVKDEEWLIFERPLQLNTNTALNLKVEVAFKIEKDKNNQEIIVPVKDSKLIVFFPTEKPTYLDFLVQGPYRTTPTRENIPSEDNQNKIIIKETAELVSQSISIVKELGYLDINFLNVLPLKPDHYESEQIYAHIFIKVKEKFLSEELLPTSDSKYTKAGGALLARGKELPEFLDKNDIQKLFSKRDWLDTNITEDKTPELRKYLKEELKIEEVDFEDFAKKITAEFLESKSDEWMVDFYGRLLEQQSLWSDRGYSKGVLRTKPIIRLEAGKHIAPFDDKEKVKVYLPSETKSKYTTVKPVLTENEDSLKFLKALGLTKPDPFAEIREFILPKYYKDNPAKDDGYFEDFEKLLKAYETIQANKKKEFIEELSKASFIDSVKNGTGENHLRRPSEVYFNNSELKEYFDGYNSVYFIYHELYEKFTEERLKPFLIELGVEDKPRRIEIDANLSLEEKNRLRGYSHRSRDIHQKDYEYEGLEDFLKKLNNNNSCLLWKLLLKNIEGLSSWDAQNFFEGEYCWSYYSLHTMRFEAKFTKTLRQEAWLVDKNNNFRKPSDITLFELPDDYIKESPNIDILKKVLGFKPDIYDQLPEDDRKKLEMVKGIAPEELKKLISEKKKSQDKKEKPWTPECEPDKGDVKIKEVEPDKIVTRDLTGQGIQTASGEDKKTMTEYEATEEDVSKTSPDKKPIGEWGEKHVWHALQEEYKNIGTVTETDSRFKVINTSKEEFEIVWLNKHSDKGKGYDFVIRKNGVEVEYIEVKAKTQREPERIEVTGTQWEFARNLYEQNQGEKYSFYVVLNAGKENAPIHKLKNPIKLWKEGKLYAHPVNFRL